MRTVSAVLFLAALAHGQVFEVASIKPAAPGRFTMTGGPGTSDPTRWSASMDLVNLTLFAYDLKPYQLIAPPWAGDLHFDIVATLPKGATRPEMKVMLKKLLEERFKLAAHIDQREMPIYEMVVGKDGLKLTKASDTAAYVPGDTGGVDREGYPIIPNGTGYRVVDYRARWQMKKQSMDLIARFLSNQIGRPVIDKTGLTDFYALNLWFILDTPPSVDPPFGPNIFKAVQDQLGLKLEPKKGVVDVMIVDHVEKTPIAN